MRSLILIGAGLLLSGTNVLAQAKDTTMKVAFGGFIDSYYAWDVGRPPTIDRSFFGGALFTTQPARHAEFNVNLAYVEAVLTASRYRGRLALQAGTSVQDNYIGEPTIGIVSGPLLSQHLQEAYAGMLVVPNVWIDGGIFYAHMGLESWASKDNPIYTRSLTAEYSPYYASGVRAIWQATPKLAAHVHLVNGWQNISETNSDKGGGVRLDYAATPAWTLTYYNFFNPESATGGTRDRIFNGGGIKYVAGATTFLGQYDYGVLKGNDSTDRSDWYGLTVIGRQQLTPYLAIVGRFERFHDPEQVVIATGLVDPFRGSGASVGLDFTPAPRLLWRMEGRGFFNDQRVFPDGRDRLPAKNSGFFVNSIGVTF